MLSSNVDDTVKCRHSLLYHHQMWITLSSADTACHAVPSSNVDDTVKCRHSLMYHHQMWMTLSSAHTACCTIINMVVKCRHNCQGQTELAVPTSNVDDTVKCRHSLSCCHQMWLTLSSADTACHAVIKCGKGTTLALARWPDARFKAVGPPVFKLYWPGWPVISIPY